MAIDPTDLARVELIARTAAADAALGNRILARFFAQQIDSGAVLHEELARHIRAAADDVAAEDADYASLADIEAERLIATLPGGWAEGDDPGWMPA